MLWLEVRRFRQRQPPSTSCERTERGDRSQGLASMEAGTSLGMPGNETASPPADRSAVGLSKVIPYPLCYSEVSPRPHRRKVQYLGLMAEGSVCTKYRHRGVIFLAWKLAVGD